jgi:hypothetical protein
MEKAIVKVLRRCLRYGGLFLPNLLAGCIPALYVDNCSDIPAGAIPAPYGTYNTRLQATQATNAEADDFVIYKYEWHMGGAELGPYGRYHLNEIVNRLPQVPFPVIVQPHVDAHLTEARRQVVVNYLAQHGIRDADQRVLVAFPAAEGLYGEEAEIIFESMIRGRGDGFGRGLGGVGRQFAPFGGRYSPFSGFRGGFRGGLGGGFYGF